ncbi:hypothetical protein A3J90_04245 [candidate division WOR-1 bacterium RIFOXYC2_FULL_37_10]|uniref:Thymidylate synthase, flavin-dependent n=1 Tax=candidate division WOR-1 bacterium RIFOXYB2_FULL_37_13 TaxID=1802579 RepID=A0A1F4SXY4_UNCSA|nr:MAG: hypothetical protein A2310_08935 [candidate division WOR-1 bacterium RIFOXYB2_FULL_37_13]OGC34146.1 MAG: hypothetical protein A3J90_04245 [candidate division WOR-1 bacterium RIFOXYC2_FULL_37_10]
MKILLAGYNLDNEVIEALKRGETGRTDVTPEVLSASYARISRDPRPINELRKAAREEVEKSRKSNQNIIFKMGHHSVAEHAVFNFDLIDVSRLAMEEIEKFRLCSYTEKSQRYQKLEDNFLIPEEIKSEGSENLFVETVKAQNNFYQKAVAIDVPPEDARYITSLATLGQVGMTVNARNLELLFRRFASSQLAEVRQIGKEMFRLVEKIAPSIILFTEPTSLDRDTYPQLQDWAKKNVNNVEDDKNIEEVSLVSFSKEADNVTLAALLHSSTNLPFSKCLEEVEKLSNNKKLELIKLSLKNMEFYDSTLREFEYADLTFELMLSSACFGQLKRHRMATLTCQPYNLALGITIPKTIKDKGLEQSFADIANKSALTYLSISEKAPLAAPYVLTGAHRKRVLFKCNARELYHISRLREDAHAQWDIQETIKKMVSLAKEAMPLTMLTICGKDVYPDVYEKIFKLNS